MSRERVSIVEVGARDGLQNESTTLSVKGRVELIRRLMDCGLTRIEAGAFVSPKWVPQMADSDQVLQALPSTEAVSFPVLTPNLKGLEAAIAAGAKEVAVFGAASETFSQKNINCSIAESLDRFAVVCEQAKAAHVRVRGYVSCLVGCPYEGVIQPEQVVPVVRRLFELGCYEVSLGDTIGVGTPASIERVLTALLKEFPASWLAMHCHDTYGMAIANLRKGLDLGLRTIDSSIGGAGGCPYAQGASGNVATEDVAYFLRGEGLDCGVDLERLVETGQWLFSQLNKPVPSRVNRALSGKLS
ncbi:hydroxymethylglutaryl-CoA lyase [Reinekea blandensis]|uniref:hydroxymethylglutaryl-CoA lyase n=1 Tax=Reinekea blandensis MED297 TaxID=314283 RepID=A4B8T5_9GAMM|nr:hydroxymethylglutaryl-CoA lyase [Reinekea blandensis]EAR11036.1 hydroxymethylglutaryl-CoA lyase [Reinekea sp. MED297] [Reinekea blandensis MED297]